MEENYMLANYQGGPALTAESQLAKQVRPAQVRYVTFPKSNDETNRDLKD